MPKFTVIGVSTTTGKDVEVVIDAVDYRAAEKQANEMNVAVSEVHPFVEATQSHETGTDPSSYPTNVQQIELTAKRWKLLQLIGAILLAIGFIAGAYGYIMATVGEDPEQEIIGIIGAVIFGLGAVMYIVARFCTWWFHR